MTMTKDRYKKLFEAVGVDITDDEAYGVCHIAGPALVPTRKESGEEWWVLILPPGASDEFNELKPWETT